MADQGQEGVVVSATDGPVSGPTQVAEEFAQCWVRQDWEAALKLCQLSWVEMASGWVGGALQGLEDRLGVLKPPTRVLHVASADEVTPGILADVPVEMEFDGEAFVIFVRLIREKAPHRPSTEGQWGVNPTSCLRTSLR